MAKQAQGMKFIGRLGNMIGYYANGQYLLRHLNKVAPAAKKSPASKRMRRYNNVEFKSVAAAVKIIRLSMSSLLWKIKTGLMTGRLTTTLVPVIELDRKGDWCKRKILSENLGVLEGFEVNDNARMEDIFRLPYEIRVDKEAETAGIFVTPFIPKEQMKRPRGSTHFVLVSCCSIVNTEKNLYKNDVAMTGNWSVKCDEVIGFELKHNVPTGIDGTMLLYFGIQYFKEKDRKMEYMREKNGLRLCCVEC